MAKFYGKIGFAVPVETSRGVWHDEIQERPYAGDVMRKNSKWDNSQGANDDININNQLSIVADPLAYKQIGLMRYVNWYDTNWKITNVEISYPRLILTIGGVWNGETP
jgi:hypothetical protein